MKALLAAALLLLALPSAAVSGGPPDWHTYALDGTVVYSSRPLAKPDASPADIRLRPQDVYIRVDANRSQVYAGRERPRPERFTELPPAQGYDCGFGEGHAVLFTDGDWHVHAFVRLGAHAERREALAVLNGLRFTD